MDNLAPVTEFTPEPSLVLCPHPLTAEIGRELVYLPFLPGESIQRYLDRLGINTAVRPWVLHLNDRAIARDEWATTFPAAGDLITLRAAVQDGGGDENKIFRTVLTIAVLVYAQGFTGLTQAFIAVGGSVAAATLFPPVLPPMGQLRGDDASPTYSLSGGSNRARLFQPLPAILGAHRVYPDSGAKTYTEFVGEDQFLYQVFNFGLTDVVLSDFKIGDTLLSAYDDVETEESDGTGALTLFPANVDTAAGAALTEVAGWVVRTSSLDATALAVELTGYLFYTGNDGLESRSVTIGAEYRKVGDPTWLDFVDTGEVTISSSSRKPVRWGHRIAVASGQYEVRLQRVTPDETDDRATADITWSQLRTYQPDTADYTGQKRVAMKIRANEQLQGQVDRFNALATMQAPVWNGAAWVTQATSNPAWLFLYWGRGKFNGTRRVFGAGQADAKIGIEDLKDWGAFCDAKGLTCNLVFDRATSVEQQLAIIARCGRGAPTRAAGVLSAVWDEGGQPVVAQFGMSNIRRSSFRVNYASHRQFDEVVVNFVNPDIGYKPDNVRVPVPGVSNPVNAETIDIMGCTDKAMAGAEANLEAAAYSYRRRQIRWETDMEGMVVRRGDVVTLSHDLTQWGYSGRLVAGTTGQLTLDRTVPFTPGFDHYIGVRYPDGSYGIYDVVYQVGESDALTLDVLTPLPSAPDADPDHPPCDYLWFFDPQVTPGKKVKIVDFRPRGENLIELVATDEDDAYYLSESDAYTHVPITASSNTPVISNLDINDTLIKVGNSYQVRITLAWDVSGEYGGAIVRAANSGEPLQVIDRTFERRSEFTWRDAGNIDIQVTLINLSGQYGTGGVSTLETYAIIGKDAKPPDVTTFLVQRQPDGTREFRWTYTKPADFAGFEIRYKLGTGYAWEDMAPLHEGLLTSSPYETNQLAAGTYTVGIKMEDTTGNRSTNAKIIQSTLGDPRIAGSLLTEDPRAQDWPGTKTNCWVDNTGNLYATDTKTWADFAIDGITWADWTSWARVPNTQIIYTHPVINVGVITTFTPLVSVTVNGTPTIEERHSDDGVGYTAWATAGSQITAKFIETRVTVDNPTTLADITQMFINLSADPVEEVIEDLDTSTLTGAHRIGVGDIRLPITESYVAILRAGIALQNVGAGWSWEIIDKDTSVGPRIKIYNASDALADATIDADIKGV